MMNFTNKIVICPKCQNEGNCGNTIDDMMEAMMEFSDIKTAFRPRGQIDGYPIWICNNCNNGGVWLKSGWISKYEQLSDSQFNSLKEDWELHNGEGTF